MLTLDSHAEKTFEIWPGLLHLVAAGAGAHAAIDAGMDAVREASESLMGDADLLSRGSLDVLPRGAAARHALEVARGAVHGFGAQSLPPLLVALPGALCDVVLAAMRRVEALDFCAVALGDALAFHMDSAVAPAVWGALSPVAAEFAQGSGRLEGGVAIAGVSRAFPGSGVGDLVVAQSENAALAALSVASLADALVWPRARVRRQRIVDPLVTQAFRDHPLVEAPGLMPPEDIWETLSKGMKRAILLRDKRLFIAAAFAVKGRGRVVGPVGGDRLLRFGVSEWR
jgi:hypothetical protein